MSLINEVLSHGILIVVLTLLVIIAIGLVSYLTYTFSKMLGKVLEVLKAIDLEIKLIRKELR